MARIESKRKRDGVEVKWTALLKKSGTRREKIKSRAEAESEHGVAEDRFRTSACMGRRLGWGQCVGIGSANLKRSPRVSEGKGRQETVSAPKRMGEKQHRGAQKAG